MIVIAFIAAFIGMAVASWLWWVWSRCAPVIMRVRLALASLEKESMRTAQSAASGVTTVTTAAVQAVQGVSASASTVAGSVSSAANSIASSVSSVATSVTQVSRVSILMLIFFAFGALLCTFRYVLDYITRDEATRATEKGQEYKKSHVKGKMSYILGHLAKLMWVISAICGSFELLQEFTRILTLTQYVSSLVGYFSKPETDSSTTPLASTSASPSAAATAVNYGIHRDAVQSARQALDDWATVEPSDKFGPDYAGWVKARKDLNDHFLEVLTKFNEQQSLALSPPISAPPPGSYEQFMRAYTYFKEHGVIVLSITVLCIVLGYSLITWFCYPEEDLQDEEEKKGKTKAKAKRSAARQPRGSWYKIRGKSAPVYILEEDEDDFFAQNGSLLDEDFDFQKYLTRYAPRRSSNAVTGFGVAPWDMSADDTDRDFGRGGEVLYRPLSTATGAELPAAVAAVAKKPAPIPPPPQVTSPECMACGDPDHVPGTPIPTRSPPPAKPASKPAAKAAKPSPPKATVEPSPPTTTARPEPSEATTPTGSALLPTPKAEALVIDSPIVQAVTMQSIGSVTTDQSDATAFRCGSFVVTALHALKKVNNSYKGKVSFYDWKTKTVRQEDLEFAQKGEDVAVSTTIPKYLNGFKSIQNVPTAKVTVGMKLTVFGPQGKHSAGEVVRVEGDKLHYSASTEPGWSGCPVVCNGKLFVHCGALSSGSNYGYALNLSAPGVSPSGNTQV